MMYEGLKLISEIVVGCGALGDSTPTGVMRRDAGNLFLFT
jgi:hypothetical protein